MGIRTKRIYEAAEPDDGLRVLVDRLWPRGVSKEKAQLDLWLKEVAPSHELRKWFDHTPSKWDEFKERYFEELREDSAELERLLDRARQGNVTLLYSARNQEHNQAVALQEFLEDQLAS